MIKIFFKNKNQGFTLVETLVAISIFTISILALLAVLTQGVTSTYYARQKIVASYLAQEGIEYMRNMRDTFVLYDITLPNPAQHGWDAFNSKIAPSPGALCASENGCYFDDRNVIFNKTAMPITDLILTACTSSTCANGALNYNSATGRYNYDVSGVNSGFTRQIKITQISLNETKISSTVYWTQGSGAYSISFSESLYNWIE